jgi:phage N-6-adenine-methyltransferase
MSAGAAHRSKQDYGTPWEFVRAVERRFGTLVVDLAASAENAKAGAWLDEAHDSLLAPWAERWPEGNLWLNPPFAKIDPWAAKCAAESAQRSGLILLLTPASIGTEWFAEHVLDNAMVLGLSPRMAFDGICPNPRTGRIDLYPKDLMLSVFGFGLRGFATWRWR